jgi:anaerobic selenocysteine-containing dehydrogenase
MSNGLTRRQFLQAGAMAAATFVVSGCTADLQRTEYLESYARPPEEGLPGENLWYASTCRQCPAGCGIIVRVSSGRARKIEGNPAHPLNQGKLCARGQAALQEVYDPDRLRNAVRQAGRGTQNFEPLYWEDALPLLARQVRDADPAAVAFLGGNLSTHFWSVVSRFSGALGARPPVVYSLGDELSGEQGLTQASDQLFGLAAVPFFDIGGAEVVFSFGANFLETWLSPVHYSRAYGQMRRGPLGQRGYLVQFEPRLSSTAASADEWVRVQPGTERLVALGLAKILAEERGLAVGSTALEGLERIDLAGVAASSGVPAEELERLGRIFASAARPLAIPGAALSAHRGGLAPLAAVQALNLLAGRLDQPGGVSLAAETPLEAFQRAALSTFAQVETLIEDMAAGRVKVLMVHGVNPVFELPAASGFREALANVPFVASFSHAVDDTAAHADLILPDHTNLEGWGYQVPALASGRDCLVVGSQQPVMRPLYDSRASADVLLALARELGGAVAEALPWDNEVDFLQATVDAFREANVSDQGFWAEWRRRGGYWPQDEALRDCRVQSGTLAAGAGLDQNPRWSEAIQPASAPASSSQSEGYPYRLHLYPSITLFDGRGANKSWLQEAPDPMTTVAWQTWIELHPHTAEELGLEDGDLVRVISPDGEVEAIVYLYPGLVEGVVAMPLGRGHEHYGRYAKGQGTNPMRLVASEADQETGALAWGVTQVRIEPTGTSQALARLESAEGITYLQEGH